MQAAAKTSLRPKKKALCIPPPVFLRPAFIHYDARLVEGGSPSPVPVACLKLSNEIPKHFLTNIIFLLWGSRGFFDISIRVFIAKKTSGMSDFFSFIIEILPYKMYSLCLMLDQVIQKSLALL